MDEKTKKILMFLAYMISITGDFEYVDRSDYHKLHSIMNGDFSDFEETE